MPTYTTNYNFAKPNVNSADDEDLWGDQTNDNWDLLDTTLKTIADSITDLIADLGTAAYLDAGTAIGNLLQIIDIGAGVPGLPALDGSRLTGIGTKRARYLHQVTAGSNGGTSIQKAWTTRPLNVEDFDEIGISIASNQLTLPAGTYFFSGRCTLFHTSYSITPRCRLRDITNGVTLGISDTPFIGSNAINSQPEFNGVRAVFAAPTVVELQYYVNVEFPDSGLGSSYVFSGSPGEAGIPEVFAELAIEKVG